MNIVWHDKTQNLANIASSARKARQVEASLLVVPEMATTGFTMDLSQAQKETEQAYQKIAKQNGIAILGTYAAQGDGHATNRAVFIDEKGTVRARYDKQHLFPLGKEHEHYQAGTKDAVVSYLELSFGLSICYDLRFPELYRALVQKGANVLVVPANWPASRREHWLTLLKARAIENQCYIIGVNRVGTDGNGLEYSGDSVVFDPWGEEIVHADGNEQLLIVELDKKKIDEIRKEYPFLKK